MLVTAFLGLLFWVTVVSFVFGFLAGYLLGKYDLPLGTTYSVLGTTYRMPGNR